MKQRKPRKPRKEAMDPMLDVTRHQPVNDIKPYFVFRQPTTVKTSAKQKEERFYAGFQLPEPFLMDRLSGANVLDRSQDVFTFEWQGEVLLVPVGSVQFVDHEGVSWDCV